MNHFRVRRLCEQGLCEVTGGPCDCPDPTVDVEVDELTDLELRWFGSHGTDEQRAEIQGWLHPDLDSLLAGQPDRVPELVPGLQGAA